MLSAKATQNKQTKVSLGKSESVAGRGTAHDAVMMQQKQLF